MKNKAFFYILTICGVVLSGQIFAAGENHWNNASDERKREIMKAFAAEQKLTAWPSTSWISGLNKVNIPMNQPTNPADPAMLMLVEELSQGFTKLAAIGEQPTFFDLEKAFSGDFPDPHTLMMFWGEFISGHRRKNTQNMLAHALPEQRIALYRTLIFYINQQDDASGIEKIKETFELLSQEHKDAVLGGLTSAEKKFIGFVESRDKPGFSSKKIDKEEVQAVIGQISSGSSPDTQNGWYRYQQGALGLLAAGLAGSIVAHNSQIEQAYEKKQQLEAQHAQIQAHVNRSGDHFQSELIGEGRNLQEEINHQAELIAGYKNYRLTSGIGAGGTVLGMILWHLLRGRKKA